MFLTNNDLKNWSSQFLLKKNYQQLIAPGFLDSLILEKNKIVVTSSDSNNNELICARLATYLSDKTDLVFFIDLAKDESKSLFQYNQIANFIKNKNNAFFIVNNFQELSGTKI